MLTLELSEHQAKIVSRSLEVYSRLASGDIKELCAIDLAVCLPEDTLDSILEYNPFPESVGPESVEAPHESRVAFDCHQAIENILSSEPKKLFPISLDGIPKVTKETEKQPYSSLKYLRELFQGRREA